MVPNVYPQPMSHHVRVVNNSAVMTPNVISQQPAHPTGVHVTVPQSVSTSIHQPPVSSHNHSGITHPLLYDIIYILYHYNISVNSIPVPINPMRPPPGLQTVTVQQTDLSPNQR